MGTGMGTGWPAWTVLLVEVTQSCTGTFYQPWSRFRTHA